MNQTVGNEAKTNNRHCWHFSLQSGYHFKFQPMFHFWTQKSLSVWAAHRNAVWSSRGAVKRKIISHLWRAVPAQQKPEFVPSTKCLHRARSVYRVVCLWLENRLRHSSPAQVFISGIWEIFFVEAMKSWCALTLCWLISQNVVGHRGNPTNKHKRQSSLSSLASLHFSSSPLSCTHWAF